MLELDEKVRDKIVAIIASSNIPTSQGLGIITALNQLKPVEKQSPKDAK